VTILVHGCFGSAGRFRPLAQVYAFQGQQTACFSYNDRNRLFTSKAQREAQPLNNCWPDCICHHSDILIAF
jgi:hypothetical protein